jgi:hypothetical protein
MKKWTIIIGKKNFSISLFHIFILFGLVFIFIGSDIFCTLSVVSNIRTIYMRNRLINKRKRYIECLRKINIRNKELKKEIKSVVDFDRRVRVAFCLPSIDEEVRMLGVGGRAPIMGAGEPTLSKVSYIRGEMENVSTLQRFEEESIDEIQEGLKKKRYLLDHTPSIAPTNGILTSNFGWRKNPFRRWEREFHKGIDIANRKGTPIIAPANGFVKFIGYNRGFGNYLELDHSFGYTTFYGHLSRVNVRLHEPVKRGDIVAYMGNSGKSTGPHLHYEVRVLGKSVNPRNYIIDGDRTY